MELSLEEQSIQYLVLDKSFVREMSMKKVMVRRMKRVVGLSKVEGWLWCS